MWTAIIIIQALSLLSQRGKSEYVTPRFSHYDGLLRRYASGTSIVLDGDSSESRDEVTGKSLPYPFIQRGDDGSRSYRDCTQCLMAQFQSPEVGDPCECVPCSQKINENDPLIQMKFIRYLQSFKCDERGKKEKDSGSSESARKRKRKNQVRKVTEEADDDEDSERMATRRTRSEEGSVLTRSDTESSSEIQTRMSAEEHGRRSVIASDEQVALENSTVTNSPARLLLKKLQDGNEKPDRRRSHSSGLVPAEELGERSVLASDEQVVLENTTVTNSPARLLLKKLQDGDEKPNGRRSYSSELMPFDEEGDKGTANESSLRYEGGDRKYEKESLAEVEKKLETEKSMEEGWKKEENSMEKKRLQRELNIPGFRPTEEGHVGFPSPPSLPDVGSDFMDSWKLLFTSCIEEYGNDYAENGCEGLKPASPPLLVDMGSIGTRFSIARSGEIEEPVKEYIPGEDKVDILKQIVKQIIRRILANMTELHKTYHPDTYDHNVHKHNPRWITPEAHRGDGPQSRSDRDKPAGFNWYDNSYQRPTFVLTMNNGHRANTGKEENQTVAVNLVPVSGGHLDCKIVPKTKSYEPNYWPAGKMHALFDHNNKNIDDGKVWKFGRLKDGRFYAIKGDKVYVRGKPRRKQSKRPETREGFADESAAGTGGEAAEYPSEYGYPEIGYVLGHGGRVVPIRTEPWSVIHDRKFEEGKSVQKKRSSGYGKPEEGLDSSGSEGSVSQGDGRETFDWDSSTEASSKSLKTDLQNTGRKSIWDSIRGLRSSEEEGGKFYGNHNEPKDLVMKRLEDEMFGLGSTTEGTNDAPLKRSDERERKLGGMSSESDESQEDASNDDTFLRLFIDEQSPRFTTPSPAMNIPGSRTTEAEEKKARTKEHTTKHQKNNGDRSGGYMNRSEEGSRESSGEVMSKSDKKSAARYSESGDRSDESNAEVSRESMNSYGQRNMDRSSKTNNRPQERTLERPSEGANRSDVKSLMESKESGSRLGETSAEESMERKMNRLGESANRSEDRSLPRSRNPGSRSDETQTEENGKFTNGHGKYRNRSEDRSVARFSESEMSQEASAEESEESMNIHKDRKLNRLRAPVNRSEERSLSRSEESGSRSDETDTEESGESMNRRGESKNRSEEKSVARSMESGNRTDKNNGKSMNDEKSIEISSGTIYDKNGKSSESANKSDESGTEKLNEYRSRLEDKDATSSRKSPNRSDERHAERLGESTNLSEKKSMERSGEYANGSESSKGETPVEVWRSHSNEKSGNSNKRSESATEIHGPTRKSTISVTTERYEALRKSVEVTEVTYAAGGSQETSRRHSTEKETKGLSAASKEEPSVGSRSGERGVDNTESSRAGMERQPEVLPGARSTEEKNQSYSSKLGEASVLKNKTNNEEDSSDLIRKGTGRNLENEGETILFIGSNQTMYRKYGSDAGSELNGQRRLDEDRRETVVTKRSTTRYTTPATIVIDSDEEQERLEPKENTTVFHFDRRWEDKDKDNVTATLQLRQLNDSLSTIEINVNIRNNVDTSGLIRFLKNLNPRFFESLEKEIACSGKDTAPSRKPLAESSERGATRRNSSAAHFATDNRQVADQDIRRQRLT